MQGKNKGINNLTTAPYTPQQNTFAERGNHITITKARCLLKDSGLDKSFWAEAVRAATYLENITPKKSLSYYTPYHKWFERDPTYQNLQLFGCVCYYVKNQPQGKFTEKGSEEGHREYGILDRQTGKVKITHHARFVPNAFPKQATSETDRITDLPQLTSDLEHQITNDSLTTTKIECPRKDLPKSPTNNPLNMNPNTNTSKKKRGDHYEWISVNHPPKSEIQGEVSDPRKIIE
ncbi:hypothetical protein O181_099661 [Austropuccinia psidii MF-1]|uniref:Integrase catalytic domain-containing protein n=1 Tax=Austropuccinia psidii MF-1 TaxID=1389203 RepID=A0A9Q3JD90_9BASI|nr:hypothetical protein [Austropuccinia psidii MF-1]